MTDDAHERATPSRVDSRARLSALARRLIPVVIALVAVYSVDRMLGTPRVGIDDANITFTYARNLARGDGLVFTPGFERVEGFTSALWMLVCAAAFLISAAPEAAILAISTLITVASASFVWEIGESLHRAARFDRRPVRDAARMRALPAYLPLAVWLAGIPAFYAWCALTLMDTGVWSAEIALLALLLVRDATPASVSHRRLGARDDGEAAPERLPLAIAAVMSAMVLTRPEAMIVVPAALGALALNARARGLAWPRIARRIRPAALAFVGSLAALTLFRLLYFGYPLPNTYYAKVSPDRLYNAQRGMAYVWEFFTAHPDALAAAAVAVVYLAFGVATSFPGRNARPVRPVDRAAFAVAVLTVPGLVLPLLEGGDHFASFRFLQPFAPLMIVPVIAAVSRAESERASRAAISAAVAVSVVLAVAAAYRWSEFRVRNGIGHEFAIAEAGRRMGERLNDAFTGRPRPSVASVITGGLGFAYEGRVADLVGLNWVAMGHSAGDRKGVKNHAAFNSDVFLEERPDVITPTLLGKPPFSACEVFTRFDQHAMDYIYRTPAFQAAYSGGYVDTPDGPVGAFFLNDWVERARPAGVVRFVGPAAVCSEPPPPDPFAQS